MNTLTLFVLLFLVACNQTDEYFDNKKVSLSSVSTPNEEVKGPNTPEVIPPVDKPDEVASLTRGVCKIETAPNYEPREKDGNVVLISDNSLCEKLVCVDEYKETPFELVHPEKVLFGCKTSESDKEYEVTFGWMADDSSTVYMDGIKMGSSKVWTIANEKTVTLKGGCHTLALHVKDLYQVISGVLGYMKVDGEIVWRTGDGNEFLKAYGPETPQGEWMSLQYDESKWKSSESCEDTSPWLPAGPREMHQMYESGSKWIWWSKGCKDLTQSFFRLSFSLAPAPTKIIHNENLCKN